MYVYEHMYIMYIYIYVYKYRIMYMNTLHCTLPSTSPYPPPPRSSTLTRAHLLVSRSLSYTRPTNLTLQKDLAKETVYTPKQTAVSFPVSSCLLYLLHTPQPPPTHTLPAHAHVPYSLAVQRFNTLHELLISTPQLVCLLLPFMLLARLLARASITAPLLSPPLPLRFAFTLSLFLNHLSSFALPLLLPCASIASHPLCFRK